LSDFYAQKRGKYGRNSQCILCCNSARRARYAEDLEFNEYCKSRSVENRRDPSYRPKHNAYLACWRAAKGNAKKRADYANNAMHRLNMCMSNSLYQTLRDLKQCRRWQQLVGYNAGTLRTQLALQFEPGMSWSNYGSVWHVDHIIPINFFVFNVPDDVEFRYCWSLDNLMPRFATTDIARSFGSTQVGNVNKQAKIGVDHDRK